MADHILIKGRGTTKEEAVKNHDANFMKLRCTETPFIGNVLMPEGIKPHPRKVKAVLKMERPSDVAAV